jgi:hypothetical protein
MCIIIPHCLYIPEDVVAYHLPYSAIVPPSRIFLNSFSDVFMQLCHNSQSILNYSCCMYGAIVLHQNNLLHFLLRIDCSYRRKQQAPLFPIFYIPPRIEARRCYLHHFAWSSTVHPPQYPT